MHQEIMELIDASICQLQQFAAIFSDFLPQMLHVAYDPPIFWYFWPRNRDCVVKRLLIKFSLSSGGMGSMKKM